MVLKTAASGVEWSIEIFVWQTWLNLNVQLNTSRGCSFQETLYFPAALVTCNTRSYSWPRKMAELVTVLPAELQKNW